MQKCDPQKRKTKIFFAKKNSCSKQELQADENISISQSVKVVENVSTPRPFPVANKSFAEKNQFHEELETKLHYIVKDES